MASVELGLFVYVLGVDALGPQSRGMLPWIVAVILVSAAAINPIEFKTSADFDRATASTGLQTFVKLGLGAAATGIAALALVLSPRTRQILSSVPATGLLTMGGVFLATSVFAESSIRTISVASALLYLTYLVFLAAAMATIGVRGVVGCILAGTGLYLLFTLGLFVLVPERGRFMEYTSATDSVIRMGGTGHPNTIAKTAITAGMIAIAMLFGSSEGALAIRVRGPWSRLFLFALLFVVVFVVVGTMSRTAILAGAAAMGMLLFDRLYGRLGVTLFVGSVAAIMMGVLGISLLTGEGPFSESAVNVVTKSGDVEELTSLTGRTVIWEEALSYIVERPVTGFGLDSAASVMSKEATGTHNLLLHVSFSAGLVATTIMAVLLVWSLVFGAMSEHEWMRAVLVYVLVSGLVEDTILESFPTTLTMLWIIALLAPILTSSERVDVSPEEDFRNDELTVSHAPVSP